MNKKAIVILGAIFILIIGTLGFLIYTKYGGTKTPAPSSIVTTSDNLPGDSTDNTDTATTSTPIVNSSSYVFKLSNDSVVSPVLFYNGNGITYFNQNGELYQANLENSSGQLQLTQKKQLMIPVKTGISKILWPNKGDDFIAVISAMGGKNTWSYYNSKTGSFVDLPAQIFSLDWLPGGDQIAYIWLDKNKADLTISSPDTSNWKPVATMWEGDDNLVISPDGQNIAFYRANSTSTENSINSVTPDAKQWRTLVKGGYNTGVLWSPDSQKLLFNKKDLASQTVQLWYYNFLTDSASSTGLSTPVDKAAWSKDSKNFYAAALDNSGNGSASDSFYKVDTANFSQKKYQTGGQNLNAGNLFLNPSEDKLFFKNNTDGALYYLDLNQ